MNIKEIKKVTIKKQRTNKIKKYIHTELTQERKHRAQYIPLKT